MEITYTWEITELTKIPLMEDLTDVITHVKFKYIGTSDQIGEDGKFKTFEFHGSVPMLPPNGENFIPLNELTEDKVIEWIKLSNSMDKVQERIIKKLKANDEEILSSLPWITI